MNGGPNAILLCSCTGNARDVNILSAALTPGDWAAEERSKPAAGLSRGGASAIRGALTGRSILEREQLEIDDPSDFIDAIFDRQRRLDDDIVEQVQVLVTK
jgi:hypothetical protein